MTTIIVTWNSQNLSELVLVTCGYAVRILEACKTGQRGREHGSYEPTQPFQTAYLSILGYDFQHLYSTTNIPKLRQQKKPNQNANLLRFRVFINVQAQVSVLASDYKHHITYFCVGIFTDN